MQISPNQIASERLSSKTGTNFNEILHSETQNSTEWGDTTLFNTSANTNSVLTVLNLNTKQTEDINCCVLLLQFSVKYLPSKIPTLDT